MKIKILEKNSGEILMSLESHELEKAYFEATQFEQMGLDVEVVAPTVTQTLTDSLGMSFDEKEEYEQSVAAEIADHEGSCTAGFQE